MKPTKAEKRTENAPTSPQRKRTALNTRQRHSLIDKKPDLQEYSEYIQEKQRKQTKKKKGLEAKNKDSRAQVEETERGEESSIERSLVESFSSSSSSASEESTNSNSIEKIIHNRRESIKKKRNEKLTTQIPLPPHLMILQRLIPASQASKKMNNYSLLQISRALMKIPFFVQIQQKLEKKQVELGSRAQQASDRDLEKSDLFTSSIMSFTGKFKKKRAIQLAFRPGNPLFESGRCFYRRRLKQGEKLFRYRDIAKNFYVVIKGRIGIFVEKSKEELTRERSAISWAQNRIKKFEDNPESLIVWAGIGEQVYGMEKLKTLVLEFWHDRKCRERFQELMVEFTKTQIKRMRDAIIMFEKLIRVDLRKRDPRWRSKTEFNLVPKPLNTANGGKINQNRVGPENGLEGQIGPQGQNSGEISDNEHAGALAGYRYGYSSSLISASKESGVTSNSRSTETRGGRMRTRGELLMMQEASHLARLKARLLSYLNILRHLLGEYLKLQAELDPSFGECFLGINGQVNEGVWSLFLMGLGLRGRYPRN